MKSRSSNRMHNNDPTPDEWVNGSWTVDCICGVNFDDGEEMVNCDECGVWVHTRCSRFVKGEKSFACDKCKNKSTVRSSNGIEETEVAQFLVELPTKTIRMNPNNTPKGRIYNTVGTTSTNYVPVEERVHVQGVPGGDPALFQGFNSVFTRELWKCTGYVPKHFNLRSAEFPCWEKDADGKGEGDGEKDTIGKAMGVVYSWSKKPRVRSRGLPVVGNEGQHDKGGASEKKGSKERKLEDGDVNNVGQQNLAKKEKLRRIVLQCGKRSRDDLGSSKDRSAKKKSKAIHKEHDSKRDKVQPTKPAAIHSPDAGHGESKVQKNSKAETPDDKLGDGSHEVVPNADLAAGSYVEKPKRNAATDEGNLTPRSGEASALGHFSDKRVKSEKLCVGASAEVQKSSKTEELQLPSLAEESTARNTVKKEGQLSDDMLKNQGVQTETPISALPKSKPLIQDVVNTALEDQDTDVCKNLGNLDNGKLLSSAVCDSKSKLEATAVDQKDVPGRHPSEIPSKSHCVKVFSKRVLSAVQEPKNPKVNKAVSGSPQSREHENRGDKGLEAVDGRQLEKDDKLADNPCNTKLQHEGSKSSMDLPKIYPVTKEASKGEGETSKLVGAVIPPPPCQHKMASAGKSCSSSSTVVISESSLSDKNRVGTSQNPSCTGEQKVSSSSLSTKKESASVDSVKSEGKHEKPKSMVKDSPKSSLSAALKASQPSRATSSPAIKQYTSVGKDSLRHQSTKSSSLESSLQTTGVGESSAPNGQQRAEKVPHSDLQSSSKLTQSALGHLPASSSTPTGLSDEELALLLHQELNSSPRVPRVPRVRHGGSLPQLSSSTATSILVKRTSGAGGKDQHTFSRRKSKDAQKESSRYSRDYSNEARKSDMVHCSPESAKTSDALNRAETSSESLQSGGKNVEQISLSATKTCPPSCDAAQLKSSSTQGSPLNNPEDDTGTNKGLTPVHRTLPGLIAEIMGEGRRMTYEELCNAVLPHWQNLRKHNGERYAYSSHSQAVLDCLRNRSEWARLVDRGPKTNTSRKKRKNDAELLTTESEDGEDGKSKSVESKSFESNKDDYPKGRRKARNGRRLALQGRAVKDDRKRRKIEESDDTGSFSSSGSESESSDDESHGSRMRASRSEVSVSSDEVAAVT